MRTVIDLVWCEVYTSNVRTLAEQIRVAFEASELSVAELLAKSGLACGRSTLQRKLTGTQGYPLRTEEAEKLSTALGITLVYFPSPPSESAA